MSKFFRFFVSLFAHAAWQRSGKPGPLPSFKVPGKTTTRLPVPSAWQIMAITWVLERLWQAFGDDVKQKLTTTKSPSVNRLGQMIPAPGDAAKVQQSVQPAQSVQSAQSVSQPVVQTSPKATRHYDTQKLSADPLPPGSVLGSLRSS